jgi:predicted permease
MFIANDHWQANCRTAACRQAQVVARLRSGVSPELAQSEVRNVTQALVHDYPNQYPAGESARVVPLREHVVGRFQTAAWSVELAVVLLLVLACVNIGMLLLARTLSRQTEFAVRIALGSTHWQIVRQLFVEGVLLALAGGAVGGSAAWWITRLIATTGDANLPRIREVAPDTSLMVFGLVVSALIAITAGLVPAVMTFRRSFATVREASGITPHAHQRVARILVGVELALAFVLVTLVGLLGSSYLRVMNVDPGFDPDHVLTLSLLPDARYLSQARRLAWFDAVVDHMRSLPEVEDAAYASTLPLSHPSTFPLFVREQPSSEAAPVVNAYLVSTSYLHVMSIPLRAGRGFDANEGSRTEPVAVVSESAARLYFGDGRAIGQHLQIDERRNDAPWARVVGVVGDVHQYGLDRGADPAVYLLFDQLDPAPQGWASLVIRSRVAPEQLESSVRRAMRDVDPLEPVFHLQPMGTYIALSVSQRAFAVVLIGAIGALALALAMGGVYGVVSYTVERRTREVGLRLALGATTGSVQRLIARQILFVALASIAAGAVIAGVLGRATSSLLFGVRPLEPAVLSCAAALIVFVTLAASALPLWRASRIDPMIALRSE